MGIGIIKGLLPKRKYAKDRVWDSIPRLGCSTCGSLSCEWGLTGSFFSDWATLALSCGVCGWALGQGNLLAPGIELESGGGIRLSGSMRRAELEQKVRKRLESYSRQAPEGSQEWDVLYRKTYEEELRKRKLE